MHTHQQTATPPDFAHDHEPPASERDAYDYLPDSVLARLPKLYCQFQRNSGIEWHLKAPNDG